MDKQLITTLRETRSRLIYSYEFRGNSLVTEHWVNEQLDIVKALLKKVGYKDLMALSCREV